MLGVWGLGFREYYSGSAKMGVHDYLGVARFEGCYGQRIKSRTAVPVQTAHRSCEYGLRRDSSFGSVGQYGKPYHKSLPKSYALTLTP